MDDFIKIYTLVLGLTALVYLCYGEIWMGEGLCLGLLFVNIFDELR